LYGSKHISAPQATNLIEAVGFAKSIGLPLVAHLTLHWSGTLAFDDHGGARFAKVREGLNKDLQRRGRIAICSFICRSLGALARDSTASRPLSSGWSIGTVMASWASSR
jgi:hypothetical protein